MNFSLPQIQTRYQELISEEWGGFRTSEVGLHMAKYALQQDEIQGRVLDNGCGNGFLGLIAATKKETSHICFHDIEPSSLDTARRNFEQAKLGKTTSYMLGNELYESGEQIDACVSNLFQNPAMPVCGPTGSELQIGITLRVGEILSEGGVILTKSMGYARAIDEDKEIQGMFDIRELGVESCTNPNDASKQVDVQYLLLTKT